MTQTEMEEKLLELLKSEENFDAVQAWIEVSMAVKMAIVLNCLTSKISFNRVSFCFLFLFYSNSLPSCRLSFSFVSLFFLFSSIHSPSCKLCFNSVPFFHSF